MREQRPELMGFGLRLKQLRNRRGYSQERLAHLAGLDRTYVSQAEQGRRNTTLITMQKLAKALDVTLGDLVNDPDDIEDRPPTV
jgi:transcriptional regulator with XRE-family HTH domain